jgi:hypothetical protein
MKFGKFEIYHQRFIFVIMHKHNRHNQKCFFRLKIKKFSQGELRDKKHEHFSTVSLPTDSVIVDHAVQSFIKICCLVVEFSTISSTSVVRKVVKFGINSIKLKASISDKNPQNVNFVFKKCIFNFLCLKNFN